MAWLVKKSDLLIHTSLKKGTPRSILEALSMGIPVDCHNVCGIASIVNDKNGFKIPYKNFTSSIESISELILKIQNNPDILNERFERIWKTTNDLTLDSKVEKIAKG